MEILKIDQLSVAARAGALDGSLAYSSIFTQHQDLITQSALSGLRGLEQTLSETGIYAQAIRSLKEASLKIEEANIEALKDPFTAASGGLQSQHTTAVVNGMRTQGWPYRTTAQNLQSTAQNAVNGTGSANPERGYANSVKQTADELELAAAYLVNQADPNAAKFHATNALNNATTARNNASNLLGQLSGMNPVPTSRYNATYEVMREAQKVIDHASSVLSFVNYAPIVQIRSQTPTVHDLSGGYSLSTWGNSGYWTLTDAAGEGILVHPNGSVDNLKGGAGWKFDHTSTFVLPNQTKITVNPGSPGDLLISRGVHAFTIGNLNGNAWPSVSSYSTLNGRDADRSTNDGYILELDGNAGRWRNNGNFLGDAGGREIIATSPLSNELRLDPTDVAISSDFQAFITEMEISDYDYDGDGKLNNIELMDVAIQTESYIRQIQEAYEQALARIAAANQALNELNEIIELLRKQTDKSTEERGVDNAAAKSELQAIERRLVAALQLLQGNTLIDPLQGNIETSASNVLGQLSALTQSGGLVPALPPTSSSLSPGTQTETGTPTTTEQPANTPNNDPLGDSLRRAGRLLSGILGGGNLNILELPPTPQPPGVTTTGLETGGTNQEMIQTGSTPVNEGSQSLSDISLTPTMKSESVTAPEDNALAGLLTQLTSLDPATPMSVNPQNLSLGLEALLTTLAQLGVFSPANQKSLTDLLQTPGSSVNAPTGQPIPTDTENTISPQGLETNSPQIPATSLLEFLRSLEQLGAILEQVDRATESPLSLPPQPTQTPSSTLPSLPISAQQLLESLTGKSASQLPSLMPQLADIVSGKAQIGTADTITGQSTAPGTSRDLSRSSQQLMLVLQGLAALGSAGAGQSTGTSGSQIPTAPEIGLGLQSLLSVLGTYGLVGNNSPASSIVSAGTGAVFQPSGSQALGTITGNFQTDPELMKIIEENLSKALQTQQRQLSQASSLFTQSQEIVQKFVMLIETDDLVREVVKGDDLSDEQQAHFDDRMKDLRKDWGMEWGSTEENTPASQSNLVSRAVQSGMMV
ncbi:hypothetical protein GCM10023213_47680 [Prosthecobacter algae]|uniref:EF-hand domain-containing protein n=1 Tax=Prosthecobacter algae TaxID=1144682 RepID=A0ABP9PTS3_9BACT